MVLAGRLLGPAEFGRLALVLSLGLIAATLPATGFPQALLWRLGRAGGTGPREVGSREAALAAAAAGTGALVVLAGAVLATLALVAEAGYGDFVPAGLTPRLALLVGAIVLADGATYLFLNLHLGRLHHRQVALFSAGRNLVKLLLLLLLWRGAGVERVVGIYLLAPLLALALVELTLPSGVALKPSAFRRSVFNEMAAYGAPLMLSAAAMAVLMRGDVVALAHYHGEAVTGGYYAAKQLMLPVLLLPVAARGLLVPALAGDGLRRADWRRLVTLVLGGAALAAAVVGLAGPWLVTTLYGGDFAVAGSLTLLVAAGAWLLAARELAAAWLMGAGRPGLLLAADGVGLAVALAGYALLIPDDGAEGAAAGLALGALAGATAAGVACWRGRGRAE